MLQNFEFSKTAIHRIYHHEFIYYNNENVLSSEMYIQFFQKKRIIENPEKYYFIQPKNCHFDSVG